MDIRNIAIIAHVDHGKTTLVDAMLKQGGVFRSNEHVQDRVMDSMDQERERGITIQAKNCSYSYKGVKTNIVDTPGHADFGGEVERILGMVDGACLLVDASEGPLPQTRFVLRKALDQNLKIIVVINKIDRPDARVQEVENEIFDLFIDLEATDEQMNYKMVYCVARNGIAFKELPDLSTVKDAKGDLSDLFETILQEVPSPNFSEDAPLSLLVSNVGHSDFLGRLAIGRVLQGILHQNERILVVGEGDKKQQLRLQDVMVFEGLNQVRADKVMAGDIAILAGIEDVNIGDTVTNIETPVIQKRITIEPPAVHMSFIVNTSPYAGKEGKVLLSREMIDRLFKETQRNVSIRFEETGSSDTFKVYGRGELQLSVLIETIRREGFELAVGKPTAVLKVINGETMEPIELASVDIPEEHFGAVSELMHQRKGVMRNMVNKGSGRVRLEYDIPARGLIGFRSNFLTITRGTGILNSLFLEYGPFRGETPERTSGAIVSDRLGDTVTYGLFGLEPRGKLFVGPNVPVYEGMVIGEHSRDNDLWVNCCREKKLTNVRASGTDEMIQLRPPLQFSLEQALEWIRDDELVEVTPKSFRMRKRILKQNMQPKKK